MTASSIVVTNLLVSLKALPATGCYRIAYSGGLDSHVLLDALCVLRDEIMGTLAAIHVDHGISGYSSEWSGHCSRICDDLGVELTIVRIDASCPQGESPEAWARQLRYQEFERNLERDEILLTAHHKDDQAETLLLQLLRGAGAKGLSAMPGLRRFGAGWHARPLLQSSRQQLEVYASERGLAWVEDDSNRHTGYDRNYLRHRVVPVLVERWPALTNALTRAASHQAESVELQNELAKLDLKDLFEPEFRTLNIPDLRKLSQGRQKNVIRYWLNSLHYPAPDAGVLRHILHDVIQSKHDAVPCVSWPGVEVRRYRDSLFVLKPLAKHDSSQVIPWRLDQPCPVTHGVLMAAAGIGNGIRAVACAGNGIEVRYRCGGESIKPVGRNHHQELKKLFQECGVPPWYRNRIPLLFIEARLAAVPGFWIDEEFSARRDERSWQITWNGFKDITVVGRK